MDKILIRSIARTFYFLFLILPLFLFPKTSEIFEFNKMIFVYLITITVSGLWLTRSIVNGKFIFQKTKLGIPILIFLGSQFLSTIFSLDQRTSFLGYYSRFNGGLLSSLCYSLLYFCYVSNMDIPSTKKAIKYLLASTLISSVWGIFEHFGHSFSCLIFPEFRVFDNSCWVQDVRNRVFASFGQPNWLAAWLTAVIPINWALALTTNDQLPMIKQNLNSISQNPTKLNHFIPLTLYYILSSIFFIALLFTKSRSGILAFAISYLIFWGIYLVNEIRQKSTTLTHYRTTIPPFLISSILLFISVVIFGSPWSPSLSELISHQSQITSHQSQTPNAPALEGGGTESGAIRKIVWNGAIDVWKKYPIFGSGVETFAYSYYGSRPTEHNLTSEWDYLYNKAHNEYLNFAATTGTVGIVAYLWLIISSLLVFTKIANSLLKTPNQFSDSSHKISDFNNGEIISLSLLSGYISILITNFFGFSTVSISTLIFLFPAMAVSLGERQELKIESEKPLNQLQKNMLFVLLTFTIYLLLLATRYWKSDYIYAKAKFEKDSGNYNASLAQLTELVKSSPKEPVYWDELSDTFYNSAVVNSENNNPDLAKQFAEASFKNANIALSLNPYNITLMKKTSSRMLNLAGVDPNYLAAANKVLQEAVSLAPTDAKLYYNLSLSYLRLGDYQNAIKVMEKTVELKPDYERAYYALALMYDDVGQKEKAKEKVKYILDKLNPNSEEAKKELEELSKK